jgi:HD-GYP domain-containing protein (c-di-GMP phosphodiesterase class II)
MPALAHLAAAVRAEHERFDGTGYPDGLSGTEIPMASRIVLAVDAYHAMTSDRPYRRALPPETARHELFTGSGMQFCPTVVRALLQLLAGPAGAPDTDRPVRFHSPARVTPSAAAATRCEQATAFALVA